MKIHKMLSEAFSPTMPIWLRNYFLYNTRRRSYKNRLGLYDTEYKLTPKGTDKEYSRLSGARARDVGRDDLSLIAIRVLNDLQIDLENAQFNEISPPPKLNSPLFSDPDKLCISWLKSDYDETVWVANKSAPHEKFILSDGKTITLQYINNKQYQSICKGFCWLDMKDPNNFRSQKQQQRETDRQGSIERNRIKGKQAEEGSWAVSGYDKSGYKQIPAVKKYADELAKRKFSGLANKLITEREKLVQLKEDLKTVFDLVFENSDDGFLLVYLRSATQSFSSAVDTLNAAVSSADRLKLSSANISRETRQLQYYLDICDSQIKEAYTNIAKYVPTSIDYDIDDVTIYDDSDWSDFT